MVKKFLNQEVQAGKAHQLPIRSVGDLVRSTSGSPDGKNHAGNIALPAGARPPFPTDVLPHAIAEFVGQVARSIGCPVDFPAVASLVAAGAAVGAARVVEIKAGWRERPSLYAVVVSPPGTAKSPAMRAILAPLYSEQQRLIDEHQQQQDEYEAHLELARLSDRAPEGKDPPERPKKPEPIRHLLVNDTTVEALGENLKDNPRGVLVFRDELVAWVRGMDQYRGGRGGTDRQFYLSAWTGEPVKIDRKQAHGNPIFLAAPFLSVLGGLQPDLLGDLESRAGRDDGFLARLLFAYPDGVRAQHWTDDSLAPTAADAWADVVRRLLEMTPAHAERTTFEPRVLRLDDAARPAWIAYHDDLVEAMNNPETAATLQAPLSKMRSYAARLALTLRLLREAVDEASPDDPVVVSDVEGAAELCDYFLAHMRSIFGRLRQDVVGRRAEDLVAWMRRHGQTSCSVRDVQRANVGGVTTAAQAEALFRDAVDRGLGSVHSPGRKGSTVRFVLAAGGAEAN